MDFPADVLEQAVTEAGLDPAADIRKDYTGRGMGGDCWGVVADDERDIAKVFCYLGIEASHPGSQIGDEDAVRLADEMCTDSMGRGTIFYFPSVDFTEEG